VALKHVVHASASSGLVGNRLAPARRIDVLVPLPTDEISLEATRNAVQASGQPKWRRQAVVLPPLHPLLTFLAGRFDDETPLSALVGGKQGLLPGPGALAGEQGVGVVVQLPGQARDKLLAGELAQGIADVADRLGAVQPGFDVLVEQVVGKLETAGAAGLACKGSANSGEPADAPPNKPSGSAPPLATWVGFENTGAAWSNSASST